MKKLTVRLEDDFSKRLRIHSIQTGESLQQMIVRLLREELARARKGRKQ
jgi:predicted HicB family RNase H-like nuclease